MSAVSEILQGQQNASQREKKEGAQALVNWMFSLLDKGSKNRDPMNEAFFDDSDTLTDVYSLVRESVQNSLDARVDEDLPVRVRFSLQSFCPIEPKYEKYFSGLGTHVERVLGADAASKLNLLASRALIIEDFNTSGLSGSTRNEIPSDSDKDNSNFFYFVHAEGSTNKSEGKKGKWGVGKVVYPKVSEIRAFFLYSTRLTHNQKSSVALGQSILRSHQIGDQGFQPDGWFASYESQEGYFELKAEEATQLHNDWDLTRHEQLGLSLVVPFLQDEIRADSLLSAVVREYFMAIVLGDLVCEISQEDGTTEVVDAESIRSAVDLINFKKDKEKNDFLRVLELSLALKSGDAAKYSSEEVHFGEEGSGIVVPEQVRNEIIAKFNAGEIVHLSVPVVVPAPNNAPAVLSSFSVVFRSHDDREQAVTFSREGILVPGLRSEISRESALLVHIDSGPLGNLLGLAEGPAHTNWDAKNRKFRDAFPSTSNASRVISFVRTKPNSFVRSLSSIDEKVEDSLLARFFETSHFGEGKLKSKKPDPDVLTKEVKINLSLIDGGFRLSSASKVALPKDKFRVTLAYGVSKGNAFSKWNNADFEVSEMEVESKNLSIVSSNGNVLDFIANSSEFSISIKGFDKLRNLEFDIQNVEEFAPVLVIDR
jgi:hypothetical protein